MANDEHWYVLKVRSSFEAVVASRIRKEGLEVFVPERKFVHRQKARPRKCLFPGYVFCRFDLENQQTITAIPGVLCIMGAPRPTPFDGEFAVLDTAIRSDLAMQVLPVGPKRQRVRVANGPMRGVIGSIFEFDDRRYFGFNAKVFQQILAFECEGWSFENVRSIRPLLQAPEASRRRQAKRR